MILTEPKAIRELLVNKAKMTPEEAGRVISETFSPSFISDLIQSVAKETEQRINDLNIKNKYIEDRFKMMIDLSFSSTMLAMVLAVEDVPDDELEVIWNRIKKQMNHLKKVVDKVRK